MSSNIVPLRLRTHLVSFLMKEMQGEGKTFATYRCMVFEISRNSFIGRYILERLEKIDYPVKDIKSFNFFLDIKATSRKRFVSEGKFFKVEAMGKSFVFLPEEFSHAVNDLFEEQFRSAFYNFVDARNENDERITQAILAFIDKYDLFEAGVTQPQLRKLYYRLKTAGICSSLQGKLYRK